MSSTATTKATRPTGTLEHLLSRGPGLTVSRTEPDIDHLAWDTLAKLCGFIAPPESEAVIPHLFRIAMTDPPKAVTVYANPLSLVAAGEPTAEFLTAATHERETWLARLRKVAGGSSRLQRHYGLRGRRSGSPILRQLEFHGVLILAGRHTFPDRWPEPSALAKESPAGVRLVGQAFGRLTVTEDLPNRKHRCRCVCGIEKTVDRDHLRSGRTKSCGCWAAELAATHEARRIARGR